MGELTEVEIFDCLQANFKLAAAHCEDLAKLPRKGPAYKALRDELRLIEGAARQAAFWRGGDARWLKIGHMMAEAHKRAGDWLRGYKLPTGQRITHREGTLHPYFMKLADNLRAGARAAERLRTTKTGKIGSILPTPGRGPHRDTIPVGWNPAPRAEHVSQGGIILPSGASA